jgi:hypothetical protein
MFSKTALIFTLEYRFLPAPALARETRQRKTNRCLSRLALIYHKMSNDDVSLLREKAGNHSEAEAGKTKI